MNKNSNNDAEYFKGRREYALSIHLPQILQYVGPGQYQYVALVSKAWKVLVHTVPSVNRKSRRFISITFTVLSRMTTCDAVFASTSRFLWALDTGYKYTEMWAMYAAGLYASIDTLALVAEKMEPYIVLQAIIDDNRVDGLHWALDYWSTIDNDPTLCYHFIWATAAEAGNLPVTHPKTGLFAHTCCLSLLDTYTVPSTSIIGTFVLVRGYLTVT
jgi:hypothetical protein